MIIYPIGRRDFDNSALVFKALDRLNEELRVHKVVMLLHPSADRGVERYTLRWAQALDIDTHVYQPSYRRKVDKRDSRADFEIMRDEPQSIPVIFRTGELSVRQKRMADYVESFDVDHVIVQIIGPSFRIIKNLENSYNPAPVHRQVASSKMIDTFEPTPSTKTTHVPAPTRLVSDDIHPRLREFARRIGRLTDKT